MCKKIFFLILLGVLISAGYPSGPVSAQLGNYGSPISLCQIIPNIETAVWVIFGLIAVVCFVIAGILFLTANGDAQKLATARSAVIWGIVGIIVGIVAFSILTIIGISIGAGSVSGCWWVIF